MNSIIGIAPLQFVHVLDLNTNVTRIEEGPQTLVLESNEKLVIGPHPQIVIPPAHYCVIQNPVSIEEGPQTLVLESNEKLVVGPHPQILIPPAHYCVIQNPVSKYVAGKVCELKLGQSKVVFHSEPFSLYPGEILLGAEQFLKGSTDYSGAVKPQPVIQANHALKIRAVLDHTDDNGVKRIAGEEWQIEGPCLFYPSQNVEIVCLVEPFVITPRKCLRIKALQDFTDKTGRSNGTRNGMEGFFKVKHKKKRVTGEEWYVSTPGAYLPGVHENVVDEKKAWTLTVDSGIRLKATTTHLDSQGIERLAGEEWLLTGETQDVYFPVVGEDVVSNEQKTVLKHTQYCVVLDPVDKNFKPQLGKRELRVGCRSFFLHPGETLEKGIQNTHILGDDEAIVLQAIQDFIDTDTNGKKRKRKCGEKWMITGPTQYIPSIDVKILHKRKQIPLSKNEGIYVQDTQTGLVRTVMGPQSYMLQANEELWEKHLSQIVEEMLKEGGGTGSGDIRKMAYFEQSVDPKFLKGRDKSQVIQYRCPSNTAVQVNNYVDKTARVVFGPDLVILGPHENFSVLSLSAGKPKKPNALQSLCLMLGPDFITDILEVETCDHARLRLQVAFNNHFEVKRGDPVSEAKVFAVSDFIGFACRQIGSKIRAAVALTPFDEFHRHSAQVIQFAVFGDPLTGKLNSQLKFDVNNLVVSSIDIQSIEPVDKKMMDSLTKSIQLAIEISTNSIEAAAKHEAMRTEQVAKGHLERQKLENEKNSEKERCKLLELRAVTAAVESTGQAMAEAQAQAERNIIECESEIEAAKLKAMALEIEHSAELETKNMLRQGDLDYRIEQITIELEKDKSMANIEVKKFAEMVNAIGRGPLAAMATAAPDMQVKMLSALGMESMLITDGKSPINLFQTAAGLVPSPQTAAQ